MAEDAMFHAEPRGTEVQRLQFAGFWRRVAASLVDGLIFVIPVFVAWYLSDPAALFHLANDPLYQPPLMTIVLIGIAGWLYWGGMEGSHHQATLGKKALGLKVTDLKGRPVGFATASRRAWPYYLGAIASVADRLVGLNLLDLLSSLLVIVSCAAVAFTERKQGFHDMMAGCLVVRRPPVPGPAVVS